jgi:hypothetical protein
MLARDGTGTVRYQYRWCFSMIKEYASQCCGSGIRYLFDPWIRDPGWVKNQVLDPESGMNIPDYISENLNNFLG